MIRTTILAAVAVLVLTACESAQPVSTSRDTDKVTYSVASSVAGARPTVSITDQPTAYRALPYKITINATEGRTVKVSATKGRGTMTCSITEDSKVKAEGKGVGSCSASWKVDG